VGGVGSAWFDGEISPVGKISETGESPPVGVEAVLERGSYAAILSKAQFPHLTKPSYSNCFPHLLHVAITFFLRFMIFSKWRHGMVQRWRGLCPHRGHRVSTVTEAEQFWQAKAPSAATGVSWLCILAANSWICSSGMILAYGPIAPRKTLRQFSTCLGVKAMQFSFLASCQLTAVVTGNGRAWYHPL
jgi:hypothetical protein